MTPKMKRKMMEVFEQIIRTDGVETWWIALPNNFKLAKPGDYARVTVERVATQEHEISDWAEQGLPKNHPSRLPAKRRKPC